MSVVMMVWSGAWLSAVAAWWASKIEASLNCFIRVGAKGSTSKVVSRKMRLSMEVKGANLEMISSRGTPSPGET
ncbi:MAG: hypothetical protein QXL98_03980 [Thermofilaceae archaeon]